MFRRNHPMNPFPMIARDLTEEDQALDMSPEEFLALSDEARRALLEGQSPTQSPSDPAGGTAAGGVPEQAAAGDTDPESDPDDTPAPQAPEAQGRHDGRAAAVREERERRRAAEQQLSSMNGELQQLRGELAVYRQLIQQGVAPAQALQQATQETALPELQYESAETIDAYMAARTQPLLDRIAQLEDERMMEREQAAMSQLRSQWADLDDVVAAFDRAQPDKAGHYSPVEKYLLAVGARALNPAYMQEQIEARAQELARQMAAEKLDGLDRQDPVTLSGVTPSRENATPASVEEMDPDAWMGLDDKTRDKYLRGLGAK